MVDRSGIYGIAGPSEICTQSGEVRLAVSWAQPFFTLRLLMFALSLVNFLSLLLSPNADIKIFLFLSKVSFEEHIKFFQKFHVGLKFEWGLYDQYWLSWERLPFEVFFSCIRDGLLGLTYANMLVTTKWPLKRAAHLTSLICVCVVWWPGSLMELSALCIVRQSHAPEILFASTLLYQKHDSGILYESHLWVSDMFK